MVAIVAMRIRVFMKVVVRVGRFERRPIKDSMVMLMGLTLSRNGQHGWVRVLRIVDAYFRGIFVIGMIAMKTTMIMDMDCG